MTIKWSWRIKAKRWLHLKIKLQTAETKLKEREVGGDRGADRNKTQTNRNESDQREPEAAVSLDGQTADVPEIDIEGNLTKYAAVMSNFSTLLGYYFGY